MRRYKEEAMSNFEHNTLEELDATVSDPDAPLKKQSRFAWASGKTLTEADFDIQDKVMLIDDFMFTESVTLIYSPPKQGKTWLGYAISIAVARHLEIDEVHYLDMDNSISTLKERNVHETLLQEENIHYMTRGTIGCEPLEQLAQIAHGATRNAYDGVCFILDTTKDFVDTDNKNQAVQFMKYCVRLRDAGATVLILHHATKNNKKISGNQVFTNTPDNVYEMKQTGKLDNIINYDLKVTHARGLVKDCRWSVDTTTLELMAYDAVSSGLTEADKQAVEAGLFVLQNATEGLSMSKLIEGMGYSRTDRNGKRLVKELTGKYWRLEEKSRNNHIYHIIKEGS
jgi:hypothetical protein